MDGGLVNPVPVSVARDMGADYVVAVDVTHFPHHTAPVVAKPPASPPATSPPPEPDESMKAMIKKIRQQLKSGNPLGRVGRRFQASAGPGIFDVLGNSIRIMEAQITETRMRVDPPDLLIRPQVDDVSFMDFHRAEDIIAAGRAAARSALG